MKRLIVTIGLFAGWLMSRAVPAAAQEINVNPTVVNVNSQGAAHANINGLIHASPHSALASAGVTTLTGLATGLTVNNNAGALVLALNTLAEGRETIVSRARVASDTNRRGMRLVWFETETTDQKGSPVCRSRALFVIRS